MKTRRTASAGNTGSAAPGPDNRRVLGRLGEEESVRYLTSRSYTVLERGFRRFRGEIDIIALRDDTLVFIEVKTRTRTDFGLPDASVTRSKQRQIRKIALGYLMERGLAEEKTACRFDVLSLVWQGDGLFRLVHYENAF